MHIYTVLQRLENSLAVAQQHQAQAYAAYHENPTSQNHTAWEAASREQQAAMAQLVTVKEVVQEHAEAHNALPTHQQLLQHLEANQQAASRESAALGEATLADNSARAMTQWTTAIEREIMTRETLQTVRDLPAQEHALAATRESLTREFVQNPTRENEQKLHDFVTSSTVSGPAGHAHTQHHAEHSHSSGSGHSHSTSSHSHSDHGHSHD